MATAGRASLVGVNNSKLTDAFANITGTKSLSLDIDPGLLDTEDFNDTWKTRIQGLKEVSGSFELMYDHDEAQQTIIREAIMYKKKIHIQILLDGTNGFKFKAKITSLTPSATVGEVVMMTVNFESTGAVSVV